MVQQGNDFVHMDGEISLDIMFWDGRQKSGVHGFRCNDTGADECGWTIGKQERKNKAKSVPNG